MTNIALRLFISCAAFLAPYQAIAESNNKSVPGNYPSIPLLSTGEDVLGRKLEYPQCDPEIKSLIINLAPGQTGAVHQHKTPLYAYVLEGKFKVTYEDEAKTTNTYSAGEAIMEAMHLDHFGFNPFNEPAKLLAIYMDCKEI